MDTPNPLLAHFVSSTCNATRTPGLWRLTTHIPHSNDTAPTTAAIYPLLITCSRLSVGSSRTHPLLHACVAMLLTAQHATPPPSTILVTAGHLLPSLVAALNATSYPLLHGCCTCAGTRGMTNSATTASAGDDIVSEVGGQTPSTPAAANTMSEDEATMKLQGLIRQRDARDAVRAKREQRRAQFEARKEATRKDLESQEEAMRTLWCVDENHTFKTFLTPERWENSLINATSNGISSLNYISSRVMGGELWNEESIAFTTLLLNAITDRQEILATLQTQSSFTNGSNPIDASMATSDSLKSMSEAGTSTSSPTKKPARGSKSGKNSTKEEKAPSPPPPIVYPNEESTALEEEELQSRESIQREEAGVWAVDVVQALEERKKVCAQEDAKGNSIAAKQLEDANVQAMEDVQTIINTIRQDLLQMEKDYRAKLQAEAKSEAAKATRAMQRRVAKERYIVLTKRLEDLHQLKEPGERRIKEEAERRARENVIRHRREGVEKIIRERAEKHRKALLQVIARESSERQNIIQQEVVFFKETSRNNREGVKAIATELRRREVAARQRCKAEEDEERYDLVTIEHRLRYKITHQFASGKKTIIKELEQREREAEEERLRLEEEERRNREKCCQTDFDPTTKAKKKGHMRRLPPPKVSHYDKRLVTPLPDAVRNRTTTSVLSSMKTSKGNRADSILRDALSHFDDRQIQFIEAMEVKHRRKIKKKRDAVRGVDDLSSPLPPCSPLPSSSTPTTTEGEDGVEDNSTMNTTTNTTTAHHEEDETDSAVDAEQQQQQQVAAVTSTQKLCHALADDRHRYPLLMALGQCAEQMPPSEEQKEDTHIVKDDATLVSPTSPSIEMLLVMRSGDSDESASLLLRLQQDEDDTRQCIRREFDFLYERLFYMADTKKTVIAEKEKAIQRHHMKLATATDTKVTPMNTAGEHGLGSSLITSTSFANVPYHAIIDRMLPMPSLDDKYDEEVEYYASEEVGGKRPPGDVVPLLLAQEMENQLLNLRRKLIGKRQVLLAQMASTTEHLTVANRNLNPVNVPAKDFTTSSTRHAQQEQQHALLTSSPSRASLKLPPIQQRGSPSGDTSSVSPSARTHRSTMSSMTQGSARSTTSSVKSVERALSDFYGVGDAPSAAKSLRAARKQVKKLYGR